MASSMKTLTCALLLTFGYCGAAEQSCEAGDETVMLQQQVELEGDEFPTPREVVGMLPTRPLSPQGVYREQRKEAWANVRKMRRLNAQTQRKAARSGNIRRFTNTHASVAQQNRDLAKESIAQIRAQGRADRAAQRQNTKYWLESNKMQAEALEKNSPSWRKAVQKGATQQVQSLKQQGEATRDFQGWAGDAWKETYEAGQNNIQAQGRASREIMEDQALIAKARMDTAEEVAKANGAVERAYVQTSASRAMKDMSMSGPMWRKMQRKAAEAARREARLVGEVARENNKLTSETVVDQLRLQNQQAQQQGDVARKLAQSAAKTGAQAAQMTGQAFREQERVQTANAKVQTVVNQKAAQSLQADVKAGFDYTEGVQADQDTAAYNAQRFAKASASSPAAKVAGAAGAINSAIHSQIVQRADTQDAQRVEIAKANEAQEFSERKQKAAAQKVKQQNQAFTDTIKAQSGDLD